MVRGLGPRSRWVHARRGIVVVPDRAPAARFSVKAAKAERRSRAPQSPTMAHHAHPSPSLNRLAAFTAAKDERPAWFFPNGITDLTVSIPGSEPRAQQTTPGQQPQQLPRSRWRTREFYVYYAVFIVIVPCMAKAVVDLSRGQQQRAEDDLHAHNTG